MSAINRFLTHRRGFTLAELLIALAILGVIATFTIPKILSSQQDSKKTATTKEAAAAVAQAWQMYRQDNAPVDTDLRVLEPYLNYVVKYTDGSSQGDMAVTEGDMVCSINTPCYKLASGAVIQLYNWREFGGTGILNATGFDVDPDGQASGITDGPGKGVEFALYFNGRLATSGTTAPGTQWSGGAYPACPTCDPSWFTWN